MENVKTLLEGSHPISIMMNNYIATPWCKCQDGVFKSCMECTPPSTTVEAQGEQSHGGDLFQHSQWCALYLTNWYLDSKGKYTDLHRLLTTVINSDLLKDIVGKNQENEMP